MRSWREIRDDWSAWFGLPKTHDRTEESSAADLCDELQALLDLSCYAAAGAVAFSKQFERRIDRLNSTASERGGILAQEYTTVKSRLEHLRETIATLHALLNSARAQLALSSSRCEWKSSNQSIAEMLTSREIHELKEALRNLDHEPEGSEP